MDTIYKLQLAKQDQIDLLARQLAPQHIHQQHTTIDNTTINPDVTQEITRAQIRYLNNINRYKKIHETNTGSAQALPIKKRKVITQNESQPSTSSTIATQTVTVTHDASTEPMTEIDPLVIAHNSLLDHTSPTFTDNRDRFVKSQTLINLTQNDVLTVADYNKVTNVIIQSPPSEVITNLINMRTRGALVAALYTLIVVIQMMCKFISNTTIDSIDSLTQSYNRINSAIVNGNQMNSSLIKLSKQTFSALNTLRKNFRAHHDTATVKVIYKSHPIITTPKVIQRNVETANEFAQFKSIITNTHFIQDYIGHYSQSTEIDQDYDPLPFQQHLNDSR